MSIDPGTIFLARTWACWLLCGVAVLMFFIFILNLKSSSTKESRGALIWTFVFGMSAFLCFPGWTAGKSNLDTYLGEIQELNALLGVYGQGANRQARKKEQALVIDCKKEKTKAGVINYSELSEPGSSTHALS